MASGLPSHQNIVGVSSRDDEVIHQREVQTPSFQHGFLLFSGLNDPSIFQHVSQEQSLLAQALGGPALGLKLQKTRSLAELIERRLNLANENVAQIIGLQDGHEKEKLKAVHFPIAFLQIGKFRLTSLNEAHLVAKCYYAKRKFVWEILESGLKKKMEILWQDITHIQAILPENRPATLKIMLQDKPSFYREIGPTPKKHTSWKPSQDFTGQEASTIRKHLLVFEPGVLDKHYSKLLQCDENLHRLSLQPFPDSESPFFTLYQPSSSTQVPLQRPSTEQDQRFNPYNSPTSTWDISTEIEVINNDQRLQDSKAVFLHRGYANSLPKDPNPDSRKQPFEFTHSHQHVHQFSDLITLPPLSAVINYSTSSIFVSKSLLPFAEKDKLQSYTFADLLAKNSMLSTKQQQPSSSTPVAASMPSTPQVQQFTYPVTLSSSLGITDSTLGISSAETEVINNNQWPQESQQVVQHRGPLDEFADITTYNSLSPSGARDTELLDLLDKEMRDIESYLLSEIDRQTLPKGGADQFIGPSNGNSTNAITGCNNPCQLQQ